jgi:hypothetical protein
MTEIPKDHLEQLLDRWKEAAEHAKAADKLGEYDGIMGSHDELKQVINKYDE